MATGDISRRELFVQGSAALAGPRIPFFVYLGYSWVSTTQRLTLASRRSAPETEDDVGESKHILAQISRRPSQVLRRLR